LKGFTFFFAWFGIFALLSYLPTYLWKESVRRAKGDMVLNFFNLLAEHDFSEAAEEPDQVCV
jgi:hypothetical protein